MFSFEQQFYQHLRELGLASWCDVLPVLLAQRFSEKFHGDYTKWQTAVAALPELPVSQYQLDAPAITIGSAADISAAQKDQLQALLHVFHPWRKGPFDLFGVFIDTEWRSDWKWARLQPYIRDLSGRNVLDIGCGSGYHCWRMRGAGARFVLGIDPTLLFVMQFQVMQKYIGDQAVQVLPLSSDDLPQQPGVFDTVFSMGLLYHRRDPHAHLRELRHCLVADGELVLETLVIDDQHGELLVPQGRYAQMRNVWNIPSCATLTTWLAEAGYRNIRCVDVNATSIEEQRATAWMQFQSLSDYLDPVDADKTIEGYPAPRRAIFLAEK